MITVLIAVCAIILLGSFFLSKRVDQLAKRVEMLESCCDENGIYS